MEKNKGGRPAEKTRSQEEQVSDNPAYNELGINRKEAAEAQTHK